METGGSRVAVVEAQGLVKRYGPVTALDGLDLEVAEGTVLGLLGPNGAGKTTAVNILATLVTPDGGTARVAGIDVRREPHRVRERIGLSGQSAAVDEHLTGRENLTMIGRLYHLGRRRARRRADELLERFDLTAAADRPVRTYSGGMRRRLDLACALVAEVPVLFLDEPTTGLDPRSRAELWQVIRELVARGTTLLLTTQYLEEADRLADRIVVIDRGRNIAEGTSEELKRRVGGERMEVTLAPVEEPPSGVDTAAAASPDGLAAACEVLARFAVGELAVDDLARTVRVPIDGGTRVLTAALRALADAGVEVVDVGLRRPTLDDVFFALTGHPAGGQVVAPSPGADGPARGGDGADGPARGGDGADGPARGGDGADGPARGGDPGQDEVEGPRAHRQHSEGADPRTAPTDPRDPRSS